MVMLLLWLIVLIVVIYAISRAPIEEPWRTILLILVIVLLLLWLVGTPPELAWPGRS